jgi:hypothetical protein
MARYKYPQILSISTHAGFDAIHAPGTPAPYSGIYRCTGCGHEAVSTSGNPLPPQGSHVHGAGQGHIEWQVIVVAG